MLIPALIAAVLLATSPAPAAAAGAPLRVLYSGDVRGHSAACECPSTPSGSLAQRATLVRRLLGTSDPGVVVDAGNLLFPSRVAAAPRQEAARRLDALTLVDGYGVLGVTAVNVGPLDLGGGVDFLRSVATRSRFPWVSANLRSDTTGEPLFAPAVLASRGGTDVAVVGVMAAGERGAGWVSTDPVPEVRRALARVPGADRVVLLAATSAREARRIARRVRGLDLVVVAGERASIDRPLGAGLGRLVAAGSRGETVGEAVLGAGRPRVVVHTVDAAAAPDPAVQRLLDERRLRDMPAPAGEAAGPDPAIDADGRRRTSPGPWGGVSR